MMTSLMVLIWILVSIAWFTAVIMTAKHTVGKEAKTWQMFLFLFIAGPLGWATVLIILVADLMECTFPRIFKKKDHHEKKSNN